MITNKISYISKTSQIYNFTNEKSKKQRPEINFQNNLMDARKSLDIMNLYNNYSKNDFMLQTKEPILKSTSVLNRFTEVESEYPISIQFNTFLDKIDGADKMELQVQIENCSEGTKIDEKELESTLEKIISIVNKVESSHKQMGYRMDDEFHAVVKYDENTGNIDIKEFAEGANDLVKMSADKICTDCSKDENISKDELIKMKESLERVKKEMDDFIMKFINDEKDNDSNLDKKRVRPEAKIIK